MFLQKISQDLWPGAICIQLNLEMCIRDRARAADHVLQIPAPTPKSDKASKFTSFQPMANLYEQSFLICLDAISMEVMEALGLDSDTMFKRHANLE